MERSFVQFSVKVSVRTFREGRTYVAECPPLDVTSQGETERDALKNLGEAIQLFLVTCFQMGTLNDVLLQSGFVPVRANRAGRFVNERTIDVSLPLLVAQRLNEARGEARAH